MINDNDDDDSPICLVPELRPVRPALPHKPKSITGTATGNSITTTQPDPDWQATDDIDEGVNFSMTATRRTSSAQVESFVCQPAVCQNSGELKLDGSRPCRIVVRFTEDEKRDVGIQAKKARMPVSTFVRLTLLRRPTLDPERNSLLRKVHFELTKQGTNLNQIAKHLNAGTASIDEGNSMVAIIARPLLSAYQQVQRALANGKAAP